ncbi:hypothetical protein RIF29_07445 [Crotalaria pallida]|uniref:Ionotropic glutamate receptor C-terminal domain-containing protein n=1 Tax=Crotalaria pallida TaxID=3830 RepID=A0AAN9PAT8_CROPI
MAATRLSCLFPWFLILLLLQLQIQSGSGSKATSTEVIKLRVGVPKKDGFREFVNVVWDSHENKYNVTGYCMDVFYAVVSLLPFNVSLEIEPYVNESGESAGTYDSLVEQIPSKYDIVVGDVTIVANRTKYVDFTLPYTESGVRMLVPVQHGRQTMWIFVRPFSWELWLSIVVFSMLIGAVIFFMEKRNVNSFPAREGSQQNRNQLSMMTSILLFPLIQVVLPQREVVAKNCSRFVLMVWLLLAFVIMQSYTANLTSILTLDQLQPTHVSVDELREGGYYVGYPTESFVYDLLVQRWNFTPSKLRAYDNMTEYRNALIIGSQGGGVAAIFDEVPYLRIYLKNFGSDYKMTGPIYRTDGFGFAFPVNSNLTSYFSRAILNVTQGDSMGNIERKYFGKSDDDAVQDKTEDLSSSDTPNLTTYSFAGLFIITGIVTVLALVVSESHIWREPVRLVKVYSKKLLRSPHSAKNGNNSVDDSATQGNEANSIPGSP